MPRVYELDFVPTYDQLNAYYGNPEKSPQEPDPFFTLENMIKADLPYPMRLSWDIKTKATRLMAHQLVFDSLYDALEEIKNYRGYDYLREQGLEILGGVYNYRPMRNGSALSTHSWGIAIDLNPHKAPYRLKRENGSWVNDQPVFIREAFLKRGWVSFLHDGMHFQAAQSMSSNAIYHRALIKDINKASEWREE